MIIKNTKKYFLVCNSLFNSFGCSCYLIHFRINLDFAQPVHLLILYLCIVKIITFILSFYILSLNAVPCSDTGVSVNGSQVEFAIDADMDSSHNDVTDFCSPFCICHCCHVHTIDFGIPDFKLLVAQVSLEPCIHFDNVGKEITHTLLQPPQV